jgi:hypothetical protein
MSSVGRLIVLVVVVAVLAVVAHDAFEVINAHKDVRNVASSAAASAASAIATAQGKSPAVRAAAGNAAANAQAAHSGDVVTVYNFDPVADKVKVTVGATASTWVLHRIDRSMTDNITATASSSIPTVQANQ